ncbi:translocation/assembly module TamB domain-containing protein [Pokkaliibacter sp. MBI-7]|uniref:translocation/assembly module TamB domain-containing protein n=1 Tax=Pokkaliibacter sp. MBI-7 TaxID=3040600 RepID=UPI00244B1E86|nr:translocation/assembly module TamB domain-containing protein [Pokkaliibacter sp. MBI-7]MDH2432650.1 translocation/assembly module TamB domain-containing protein [Pokkaliibacter sp. MBI-7]
MSADAAKPPKSSPSVTLLSLPWRLLRIVLAVLCLLLVLLLATLGWLAGSTSGTRTLLNEARGFIPGQFSYGQVEGTLLGHLQLSDIRYQDATGKLQVSLQQLTLNWQPAALLSLSAPTLHVKDLLASGLQVQLPPSSPSEPGTEPLTLPDIALPLGVQLDHIELSDASLTPAATGSGEPPATQQIKQLLLSAHNEGSVLKLQTLSLDSPIASASITGQVEPVGKYPLTLEMKWHLALPQQPVLDGSGRLSGDLQQLQLTQLISGPGQLKLDAEASDPLGKLAFKVKLGLQDIQLGAVSADLQDRLLNGELTSSGTLQDIQANASLHTELPQLGKTDLQLAATTDMQQVSIQQLQLLLPDSNSQVQLQGRIAALQQTPTFDLKGHWQRLRYPLQGEAQYQSPQGEVSLSGPLDNYQLALHTEVAGTDIPAATISLQGQGSTAALRDLNLQINTLGGTLSSQGQLAWAPQPGWKLALKGDKLNPGKQWPDLAGTVGFALSSEGQLQADGPHLTAVIEQLSGSLHQQPLKGQGKVAMAGQDINIDGLDLSWGNARLQTAGRVNDQLDLNWKLQASNLNKLLPQARGSIDASGTLSGQRLTPAVKAKISASQLGYTDSRLDSLKADIALDLSWQQAAAIDIEASKIYAGGQRLDSVVLKGQGVEQKHSLNLTAKGPMLQLQTQLSGGWNKDSWSGQISQFDLRNDDAGHWQLRQPAALKASATAASLGSFCLNREHSQASLCSSGQWSGSKGSQGKVDLRQLPLDMLTAFLPGTSDIAGYLNADANFSQAPGKAPRFTANAALQDSKITLDDPGLSVSLNQVSLTASGENDNLNAQLQLQLAEVKGNVQANVAIKGMSSKQLLSGNLSTQMQDLRIVSVFVPDLQDVSGRLQGNLNLGGTLQQPAIRGKLGLYDAGAAVPVAGLQLKNMQLELADAPDNPEMMTINGKVDSGKGTITIGGSLAPLAGKVDMTLKGQDFQAMGTEDIQTWISPDMSIRVDPEKVQVRGELSIPKALIQPPQLSSAVTSSGDTVIVTGKQDSSPLPGKQGLDVNLRLTLGKDVNVNAYGFKGRLEGSILVSQTSNRAASATGNINVAAGQYTIYGQDLNINRGSLVYTGGPVDNPGLDMRVTREFDEDNVTVGAQVSGTIRSPKMTLISTPSMPDSSLLSYLILGKSPDASSSSEQEMMMHAALALGAKGGNALLGNVGKALNLDTIGIDTGSTLEEASLSIGKYLTPDLYIKYGMGLIEPSSQFLIRYKLTRNVSFESQTGTTSSGADVFYTLER